MPPDRQRDFLRIKKNKNSLLCNSGGTTVAMHFCVLVAGDEMHGFV